MKLKFIGAIFFSLITLASHAQDEKLTTFILVRHAEKEAAGQNTMSNNKDPKLSEEGLKRAERLAALLSKTKIDAIYSTPYIRTRKTVESLAQSKSLTVLDYEPGKLEAIDKILIENQGKTIVISGHSNTIPKIANHLTKSGDYKDFDDADYGNIFVITVSSTGKSNAITWLRY